LWTDGTEIQVLISLILGMFWFSIFYQLHFPHAVNPGAICEIFVLLKVNKKYLMHKYFISGL
jgi:hypothetical protein